MRKLRASLKQQLDDILLRDEEDWKQRSRIDWVKAGDRNTRFFQHLVRARRQHNSLDKVMIADQLVEGPRVIEKHIIQHFTV